jgi:GH15 family glucan-1,4-alpha-glucosidase
MCWVALDRAIALADHLGAKDRVEGWAATCGEIRTAILEHGWSQAAVAYANDVGLLAEEVDVGGVEMIGNYPQAFSHIGLVNAAWAITEAERR